MKTVGAYEAKTHLARLLDEVQRGHWITISRHGRRVCVAGPVPSEMQPDEVVDQLLAVRQVTTTGGRSVREMIEDGRRS